MPETRRQQAERRFVAYETDERAGIHLAERYEDRTTLCGHSARRRHSPHPSSKVCKKCLTEAEVRLDIESQGMAAVT